MTRNVEYLKLLSDFTFHPRTVQDLEEDSNWNVYWSVIANLAKEAKAITTEKKDMIQDFKVTLNAAALAITEGIPVGRNLIEFI